MIESALGKIAGSVWQANEGRRGETLKGPNGSLGGGSYQLILFLAETATVEVGRLGRLDFASGFYFYTGRQVRHLTARIERHLRREKPRRWHIDYLTTRKDFRIVRVLVFPDNPQECRLNRELGTFLGATWPLPGFGSSDCQHGCLSHLLYLPDLEPGTITRWLSRQKGLDFLPSDENGV